ncbi:hypothetical protein [Bacillus marinisedimentorum]|uniref:hypothetical protein n=1 Tax=Bacillus marinisedimentorum TaxID=1821260 RepID=UPI0007E2A77A|nr:hypothetical protein [Bacillus marinisedimentorum]
MPEIHWYDWIAPTSPFAALVFGLLFTLIAAFSIWFGTKAKKPVWIALLAGSLTTVIGVIILNAVGFY